MFQFQYGSIGRRFNHFAIYFQHSFQFQYGSIGSVMRLKFKVCLTVVSIPVWFDWKFSIEPWLPFSFNVSIPVWFDWKYVIPNRNFSWLRSFNSSMVRLEAWNTFTELIICFVSIPVWFDWKAHSFRHHEYSKAVSIPVWFDWKVSNVRVKLTALSVSIPVWFDWKFRAAISASISATFQFQYGSIGSDRYTFMFIFTTEFQFQYGSIGSGKIALGILYLFQFQFQYGSIGRQNKY